MPAASRPTLASFSARTSCACSSISRSVMRFTLSASWCSSRADSCGDTRRRRSPSAIASVGRGGLAQWANDEPVDLPAAERDEHDDVRRDEEADVERATRRLRLIVEQDDRADREHQRGDGEDGEVDEQLRTERWPKIWSRHAQREAARAPTAALIIRRPAVRSETHERPTGSSPVGRSCPPPWRPTLQLLTGRLAVARRRNERVGRVHADAAGEVRQLAVRVRREPGAREGRRSSASRRPSTA